MPVHKVKGGYQWGSHGKVYKDRADAVKQGQAAHANGYKEPKKVDPPAMGTADATDHCAAAKEAGKSK